MGELRADPLEMRSAGQTYGDAWPCDGILISSSSSGSCLTWTGLRSSSAMVGCSLSSGSSPSRSSESTSDPSRSTCLCNAGECDGEKAC